MRCPSLSLNRDPLSIEGRTEEGGGWTANHRAPLFSLRPPPSFSRRFSHSTSKALVPKIDKCCDFLFFSFFSQKERPPRWFCRCCFHSPLYCNRGFLSVCSSWDDRALFWRAATTTTSTREAFSISTRSYATHLRDRIFSVRSLSQTPP